MTSIKTYAVNIIKRSPRIRLAYRQTSYGLARVLYTAKQPKQINHKLVVFEAFLGRSYAGSPKAIYEQMLADPRFDDFEFVWFFRKPERAVPIPELNTTRTHIVKYKSSAYYRTYQLAKYWVSNSIIPGHIKPTAEQVFVQTWHGTPLKQIGLDVVNGTESALTSTPEIDMRYRREGGKDTYFLSSSEFTTTAFASAFALPVSGPRRPLVLTGNPRNDPLVTHTQRELRAIRKRLRIPAAKKVLLYAPTWRDDQHQAGTGYVYKSPIDFHQLVKELGDDWIILFRAHYLVSSVIDFEALGDAVIDVSAVQEINDLYLISDALVTDYSSSFFDYALLERPMLFFMYDREHYERELRGFYMDPSEVPGPIVQTQAELTEWLLKLDEVQTRWAPEIKALNQRMNPHDDGHSSQRVLDLMVDGTRPEWDQ